MAIGDFDDSVLEQTQEMFLEFDPHAGTRRHAAGTVPHRHAEFKAAELDKARLKRVMQETEPGSDAAKLLGNAIFSPIESGRIVHGDMKRWADNNEYIPEALKEITKHVSGWPEAIVTTLYPELTTFTGMVYSILADDYGELEEALMDFTHPQTGKPLSPGEVLAQNIEKHSGVGKYLEGDAKQEFHDALTHLGKEYERTLSQSMLTPLQQQMLSAHMGKTIGERFAENAVNKDTGIVSHFEYKDKDGNTQTMENIDLKNEANLITAVRNMFPESSPYHGMMTKQERAQKEHPQPEQEQEPGTNTPENRRAEAEKTKSLFDAAGITAEQFLLIVGLGPEHEAEQGAEGPQFRRRDSEGNETVERLHEIRTTEEIEAINRSLAIIAIHKELDNHGKGISNEDIAGNLNLRETPELADGTDIKFDKGTMTWEADYIDGETYTSGLSNEGTKVAWQQAASRLELAKIEEVLASIDDDKLRDRVLVNMEEQFRQQEEHQGATLIWNATREELNMRKDGETHRADHHITEETVDTMFRMNERGGQIMRREMEDIIATMEEDDRNKLLQEMEVKLHTHHPEGTINWNNEHQHLRIENLKEIIHVKDYQSDMQLLNEMEETAKANDKFQDAKAEIVRKEEMQNIINKINNNKSGQDFDQAMENIRRHMQENGSRERQ